MSFEEIEILRKKAKNTVMISAICGIIIILIIFLMTKSEKVLYAASVAVFIIPSLISAKPTKKFKLAFKERYVLESLKSVFDDLVYEPEKGIDSSIIDGTGMMNMGDRYSSNDYVSAKYKNISIMQADVHIEEINQDDDGHSTYDTIFQGKWMVFDFNKNFKANVQVCQKGFGNAIVNNWFNKLKFKKVMMEDQFFNNNFTTYAQNEYDAFYILTPSLIERIKKVTDNVKGKVLYCFVNNQLHVGIQNNKDSFEHGIFKKINEDKVIEEVSKEIKLIKNFVDELNLDNDLFKKGGVV